MRAGCIREGIGGSRVGIGNGVNGCSSSTGRYWS